MSTDAMHHFLGGHLVPFAESFTLLNGCKEKLSKTCWIGWKRSECNALSSGIFLAQFTRKYNSFPKHLDLFLYLDALHAFLFASTV